MTDFRFRRLGPHKVGQSGSTMELAIPLPKSPTGKFHRCCPVPDCTPNIFQIGECPEERTIGLEAVRRAPGTRGLTCPYCGHDGDDDDFVFRDDIQAAKDFVKWAALEDVRDHVGAMFDEMARDVNRTASRSRGFVKMTMASKHGHGSPRPFAWREDLLREMTCPICRREYGVYAIGLFCPDCGASNVASHFGREVDLVKAQVEIAQAHEEDRGRELSYRLLGNAHEDVLTAFEATLKTVYRFAVCKRHSQTEADEFCSKKSIRNRFQNVEGAQELFAKLGVDLFSKVTEADLERLRANIQKRHVVGHNLSIVDDAYADAAGAGEAGETVSLVADEILSFGQICANIISRLEDAVPELHVHPC